LLVLFDAVKRVSLPAEIVEEIVEEDDADHAPPDTGAASPLLLGSQGDPCCEGAGHAAARNEEQWTSAASIDEKREDRSFQPVRHADDSVELVLEVRIRDSNIRKNFAEVVARETCTAKLREKTTAHADKETSAVSRRIDEIEVAATGVVLLLLDRGADFGVLELDDFVLLISICLVFCENHKRFFLSIVRDKPSGAFWEEPDQAELQSTGHDLEQTG